MRHFIAYHNTEKMGRSLHDGEPLRLLTNKHVNHLLQNMVWFVTGEGAGARQYSLGSVFNVAEVGDAAEDRVQAIRGWHWTRVRAAHSDQGIAVVSGSASGYRPFRSGSARDQRRGGHRRVE